MGEEREEEEEEEEVAEEGERKRKSPTLLISYASSKVMKKTQVSWHLHMDTVNMEEMHLGGGGP